MCELCGKWACPPQCPSYDTARVARCVSCDAAFEEGEVYYEMDGKPYCVECVENATMEELVRICETDDFEELLGKLGLTRRVCAEEGRYYGG